MKHLLLPIILMISLSIIQSELLAQKEPYEMIGKSTNTVVKTYGKPAYHDKSNPDMECIFYQTKDYRMVFVANKKGVYQAEKCLFCKAKKIACNNFDALMKKLTSEGFAADSLGRYEYNFLGEKVRLSLSVFENAVLNKYELRMKAQSSEG